MAAGVDAGGKTITYKDVWTWDDVHAEWVEGIRQDHPNLYAVTRNTHRKLNTRLNAQMEMVSHGG